MLPCQSACPNYRNGCHKTCLRWKAFQEEQALQREAKKRYLRFHLERCAQMDRQLLSLQCRHPF